MPNAALQIQISSFIPPLLFSSSFARGFLNGKSHLSSKQITTDSGSILQTTTTMIITSFSATQSADSLGMFAHRANIPALPTVLDYSRMLSSDLSFMLVVSSFEQNGVLIQDYAAFTDFAQIKVVMASLEEIAFSSRICVNRIQGQASWGREVYEEAEERVKGRIGELERIIKY